MSCAPRERARLQASGYDVAVTAPDLPSDPSLGLLKRWQESGDVDALDELLRNEVRALAARLRARGRGMLHASASASDLAQEAVLRLLRLEDAPVFEDAGALRAYLWTAAWRLLINRGQARGRSMMTLSGARSGDMGLVLPGGGGASAAEREDQNAALNVVMNLLRDEDREVLELVYFRHLEIEQVAQQLGIQRSAADMRLSRARRRLAEKMVGWAEIVQ